MLEDDQANLVKMVKLQMRMVVKALEKEKQFSQLEIWCYQDSLLSHLGIVIIMMIISISHVHDKYEGSRYIKYSDRLLYHHDYDKHLEKKISQERRKRSKKKAGGCLAPIAKRIYCH